MRKQKIILLIDSLGAGGAQRQLTLLARLLKDQETYEPIVVCYHNSDNLKYLIDEKNIPYYLIKKKYKGDIVFFIKLIIFLRQQKPKILLSYLNTANMWARLASLFVRIDKVITSERNIDLEKSKARVKIEKLLFPLSDKVIVNAFSIKEMLCSRLSFDSEKIQVIYNAVDLDSFYSISPHLLQDKKKTLGLELDDFVITLPGRLQEQKNHICLIKAISELKPASLSRIKVLFVGNETDLLLKEKLVSMVTQLNLQSKIKFCDVRTDMLEIYNLSDIIVLPSLWEGLPNVILEAMACAKPVVASDIADNKNIIEHGVSGYIFDSDNSFHLAEMLEKCLVLESFQLQDMGQKGKRWIDKNCTVDSFISNYTEAINSININN